MFPTPERKHMIRIVTSKIVKQFRTILVAVLCNVFKTIETWNQQFGMKMRHCLMIVNNRDRRLPKSKNNGR